MGWLTRIKDSLLSKIRKKIPKKDLESAEKVRKEKKIKKKEVVKEKIIDPKEIKKESENLVQETPKKKNILWFVQKKRRTKKNRS